MQTIKRTDGRSGFTLVEVTIALLIGAVLMGSLYRLWTENGRATMRIGNKSDFRERATLATTQLNRSITMAGYGMSKLDVLYRSRTQATDTLVVYSNPTERRTTLRDTARIGATSILIFTDTGFTVGGRLAITDSIQQEYATIAGITGDSANGFTIALAGPLLHRYEPGVPDIYPVKKEKFFIDQDAKALVRRVDGENTVLAVGMTDFRADLKDGSGVEATSYKSIRVVIFSMTGTYKAPAGSFNTMRFSSTVIPRNIL